MLIGYFDLISKIEIDRKNILNPKMCANPFILEIYSYIVERSFFGLLFYMLASIFLYRYLVLDFQYVVVVAPYLNVTIYDADIRLNDSIKGVTNNIII